ncbi:hypothetical protein [Brevibacterium casei]|uniref:Integral membrane protein n=1 Tax=Brevibacterium casei S18 TaxID=1229781 RepID=K9B1E8_9MICO|nr:hypothetical protein [Brevibacterium casei]EKU48647.1 hypothetical protein C272_03780 [Brevibacterium casei S18]
MSAAIVTLFLPALVLAAIGVMLLVSSLRRPASAPVAGFVLRTLAALGLLGAAVVAGVGPWLPIPYGIVVIPLLALVFGFVWVVGFLGAALLVEWAAKR